MNMQHNSFPCRRQK